MRIPIYQVDAFAEQAFGGNPAAVCPLEAWLNDRTLQAIAEENNLSETAFYVEAGDRIELRWFTPLREVKLCGHATLAAAAVWFLRAGETPERVVFDSRSGVLRVTRDHERLSLDFPVVPSVPCEAPPALIEGLGQEPLEVRKAADYLAVFESEEVIAGLEPDFSKLRELDLQGVIATAPGDSMDFVSRFFAPNFGIDEDPVTGSAHCALTPYWVGKLGRNPLLAKQLSRRSGLLACRLEGERVHISGKVRFYLEGEIRIECLP